MPYNFVADSFHTKKLCSSFLQAKCDFTRKSRFAFFSPPLGEGGAKGQRTNDHLWLIGKRVMDFLLVLIELFSLGVTAEALYTSEYRLKISDFAPTGAG